MSDLEKGEIYLIKNKVNGKCYIGQAFKYVSSEFKKWGTEGRWKSHVREALNHNGDHCLLLNQAIRKYGDETFEITKLCDCDIADMNKYEIQYIQQYNSLVPNGYNLKSGGSKGKDSEETKKRKSEAKKKRVYSDDYKISIKLGQRGNRRNKEDIGLPEYICAHRKNGKINGYDINKFYTNIELSEYIRKRFKTLDEAKLALEELKLKYSNVIEFIENFKNKNNKAKKKRADKKLPPNIFAIFTNEKLVGFYVEGLKDSNGNTIPKKIFTDFSNKKNFQLAHEYKNKLIESVGIFESEIQEPSSSKEIIVQKPKIKVTLKKPENKLFNSYLKYDLLHLTTKTYTDLFTHINLTLHNKKINPKFPDLPEYIYAKTRTSRQFIYYEIDRFYIDLHHSKYIRRHFTELEDAIAYLQFLKQKYSNIINFKNEFLNKTNNKKEIFNKYFSSQIVLNDNSALNSELEKSDTR
jgi:hypothetical protein